MSQWQEPDGRWQGPDDRWQGPEGSADAVPGPAGPPAQPAGPGPADPGGRGSWSSDPTRPWGRAASAGAPQPGIVPLRPLSLGEIWDGGFRAFRQNPKVLVGLSAVVVVAVALVQLGANLAVGRDLAAASTRLDTGSGDPTELFGLLQSSLPLLVGGALLQVVSVLVLNGVLIVAVSRAVLGRTIGFGELWAACRRKVLPLVGLSLLIVLAVALVGALALVPGIAVLAGASGSGGTIALGVGLTGLGALVWLAVGSWLGVRWSMATPAMLLEDLGVGAALGRSSRLTRGSFWRLLGILLLTTVVVRIVVVLVAAPFSVAGTLLALVGGPTEFGASAVAAELVSSVGGIVGSLVAYPFLASVTALLYVDLRMRREGLDVELHRAAAGPAQG